ncbi:MAG: BtpA/SgcQ family protein [bacterium]|nr:BtpA/SgcQ family protein [bacterium]
MDRKATVESIFGVERALIGVIHLQALPGSPSHSIPVRKIVSTAVDEARRFESAGFEGLILENMHDRPYSKRSVGPEIVASMTAAAQAVGDSVDLPFGVQVLAGANREALAIAHTAGAAFVRVEGFVFAHVADEGLMEADAGDLLRYRKAIGADGIRVFADIKKKHSSHALTADIDLVETAHAAEFFRADGVVVTGTATGRPTDPAEVDAVSAAIGVPTLVGSGITAENIARFGGADALIVGSSVKVDGAWSNPLDATRLEALARAFRDTVTRA